MRELTDRQREILDWVLSFQTEHGMPPTVREIGRRFRIASSSVFVHLKLIEKKGHLRRGKLGARSLELPGTAPVAAADGAAPGMTAIPEVGRVAAGQPLLAAENVDGEIRVDPALLRSPREARHFCLRVVGDSMIEAGILEGDRLLVRQQPTAADGQIVVALLNDEATVKRFFREGDRIRLQPANSRMEPIYAKEVAIQGVVVGVLRTYH